MPLVALLRRFKCRVCRRNLTDMQRQYVELDGIHIFFETIAEKSGGGRIDPMSATHVGDKLIVTQTRHTLTVEGRALSVDVAVVWRIVDGRVVEIWDIVSSDAREAQNG